MSGSFPNPYGPTCKVTLDLPWDVAELLVKHGPGLLNVIGAAVKARKAETHHHKEVGAFLDKQCEDNKAEWAALALHCEAEIARRSNGPGQRSSVVKQLAAELKVTASFINSICRVFKAESRQNGIEQRKAQIIRLYFKGWSNAAIAREVKLAPETVSRLLASEKDLLKTLRASTPDYDRLKAAATAAGGAR